MNFARPNWETLASLFEGKIKSVFISSPWFSSEGIEKLDEFLPKNKVTNIQNIEIWFRMNVEDNLLGFTDYESLLDFAERVRKQLKGEFKLYASDNLHAKVYATDKNILITSANLTKKGFADNIEIGIGVTLSTPLKDAFDSFVKEQRKHLAEVSVTQLRNFVKHLKSKTIQDYHGEISKLLNKAQKHMSLVALEEKFPPHSKFPIR